MTWRLFDDDDERQLAITTIAERLTAEINELELVDGDRTWVTTEMVDRAIRVVEGE